MQSDTNPASILSLKERHPIFRQDIRNADNMHTIEWKGLSLCNLIYLPDGLYTGLGAFINVLKGMTGDLKA